MNPLGSWHSFLPWKVFGFGLGALWDVGSDTQGNVAGARPGGFHPRWVDNPEQGSEEEKEVQVYQ